MAFRYRYHLIVGVVVAAALSVASAVRLPLCTQLSKADVTCPLPANCTLGQAVNVSCTAPSSLPCAGFPVFASTAICTPCYLLPVSDLICKPVAKQCPSTLLIPHVHSCEVRREISCSGNRSFKRRQLCHQVGQKSWKTALIYSITLGGFGADRFYLGQLGWGFFKLLSFGGMGVWTIIDVVLIAVGYITPWDGSLYHDWPSTNPFLWQ